MTTSTTETVSAEQQAEILELLLTGGEDGFLTLLSRGAVKFTNGRVPSELSEEAQEYVLESLESYAQALDVARNAGFLMALGAPDEVVNEIARDGIPFMEEFDRRAAEFVEKWPEYAEWVGDQPVPTEG